MKEKNVRHVIGCMTGTSIDGLSVALVRIEGHGLEIKASLEKSFDVPFGPMAAPLRKVADQVPVTAEEVAKTSWDFGVFHANALEEIVRENPVNLISLHGQTVFHSPPYGWQLINPAPIAQKFKIPIVYDLRASDLAHGGEGAPLTPLADFIFFRANESRAVVNLGGFCNITLLPATKGETLSELNTALEKVQGQDVCSCNQILDHLARVLFNADYDKNGQKASEGKVLEEPFEELVKLLAKQTSERRSLGTGDELTEWVNRLKETYAPVDLARTACAAIAQVITNYSTEAERLILAGGGVFNLVLKEEIASRTKAPVEVSDNYGIPVASREAAAWAVLGDLCKDRVPITLPQVTGVKEHFISGAWVFS